LDGTRRKAMNSTEQKSAKSCFKFTMQWTSHSLMSAFACD
ncbi:hypothetical protein T11_7592, partial [Trichinella zimbabwensis]